MKIIENEGAIFRGPSREFPKEVWDGSKWLPYKGAVPKPVEWGDVISEEEAKAYGYKPEAAAAEPAPKEKVGADA